MGKVKKFIIGIDEAGRGPLAGPVVVAGIKIKSKIKSQKSKFWRRFKFIKDSKKLSEKQREEWFNILTNYPKIEWAVAKVGPGVIDKINIARAANLGARRVYSKLCPKLSFNAKKLSLGQNVYALLDGSLYLSKKVPHETIIKGDENKPVIAAASIIAKVTRDRIMLRLHKKYPRYRFDIHKGYGTKFHRKIIRKLGHSEIHRRSFRF